MHNRAPYSPGGVQFAHGTTWCRLGLALAAVLFGSAAHAEPVSFRNEVMAILSRAGCNMGPCHGNQNGKNGFKLSLRGQDPEFDLVSLTRDMLGRRTNALRPADSLILLKATAAVPHEGGQRFRADSPAYDILLRWIAEGLRPDPAGAAVLKGIEVAPAEQILSDPADRVQLRVHATFSDGSKRDVTRLAVYEPSNTVVTVTPDGEVHRQQLGEAAVLVRYLDRYATVRLAFIPDRPGFVWPNVPEANDIDRQVFARLRALKLLPSELCSDNVFIRRAFLDVVGLLPAAEEVRAFLDDRRPDKRTRLIDDLLRRPEFADFWALKWSDLLRNEEKALDRKGVQEFHRWIQRCLDDGKPLNEFARELLAARGSTYANPAANYYRALRDPQIRAEATAQVFLGIRLQCARCHNHPFDVWTQEDYHRLSAFFARLQYRILENNRRDRLDMHEFDGEQVVWQDREGEVTHPRTGQVLEPRFLGSAGRELAAHEDRLQALADWVARPDNPFFARAQANRVWYHLLGKGIVDPNDDFRLSNPPVNGPLLDALSKDFAAHGFDVRHLVRTILASRIYQLAAVPNETNRDDEANFSRALVRPLQAESLLDALSQVTGVPVRFSGYPLGTRATQLAGVKPYRLRDQRPTDADHFLKAFGKPERSLSCECERSEDMTLEKAFQMISGPLVNQMLSEPDNRIGKLLAAGKSDREMLEEFMLAALARRPTEEEHKFAAAHIAKRKNRREAWEDLVWGLVNSKAFVLRQ